MQKFILTKSEYDCLFRQDPSTKRNGGFQSLLVKLQDQTDSGSREITLYANDLERIPRYAFDYKNGGWENRLVTIFHRTLGSKLGR